VSGSGPWTWGCNGSNGGSNTSCSAPVASQLVNGQCGPANGVPTSTAPTTGLCSAGSASSVSGTGPWNWSCAGSGGGTTAQCSNPVSGGGGGGDDSRKPGPSLTLFNAPFYTCSRNFYVATTGADTNSGTQTSPWKTIGHADATVQAGDCVNVQPGTYANAVNITRGGNAPTPSGYVVYRCTQLDACKVTASGFAVKAFNIVGPNGNGPGFVVIDGFEIAAATSDTYGQGIQPGDGGGFTSTTHAAHHIWLLNNIIHGYGQAGINAGMGEFYYFMHNTAYDNARATCDAQGSGIAIVVPSPIPNYTPSGMDTTFAPPFRNVISFNVTHNNALTRCGDASNKYDTDGNGIIMDTFKNDITNVTYPYQTLVAFNVSYNNGGGGVHVFRSSNVTVANNTAFNNQIDPFSNGFPGSRPQIDVNDGDNNVFINNIAYAVPATTAEDPRCEQTQPCTVMYAGAFLGGDGGGGTDVNNTWHNNVSFAPGSSNGDENDWFNTDAANNTYTCTANQCSTDPLFDAPSSTTTLATSVNDPGNFALQATSPALGYAQPQPYLPSWTTDAGACDHSLTVCP
jgi:parallel beta-helix repeat protein